VHSYKMSTKLKIPQHLWRFCASMGSFYNHHHKIILKSKFSSTAGLFFKTILKMTCTQIWKVWNWISIHKSTFGRFLCSKKYQTIWCTLRPIRASSKTFCQSSLSHIIYHTHAWLIVCMIIKHLLNLRPINLNCVSNLPFLWATYFVNILFLW
jgi:hypothetical protein